MSDQNTSLPVRTEADVDERLQSKIIDYTDPTKGMQVDSDKNAHVEMHGNDPLGTDKVVALSESGNVVLDGVYDGTNNTVPSSVGLIASERAVAGIDQMLNRLTSVINGLKVLLDVSIHDEDGNAFSASNPLPVTSVDSEGVEVNNYKTDAAVAAGAANFVNHDYVVTALKTLKLSYIWGSASGKMKIEVQVETGVGTGVFASKWVGFNSTANPNIPIEIKENIAVAAGVKVRVVKTNLDNQPQDLYTTISGHEI